MPLLHLFNPDNDLALASDLANYTPPKAAMQLRRDGALLPMWYADPDDRVVTYGVNAEWLDKMHEAFPTLCGLHDHRLCNLTPSPWGWSKSARASILREGVEQSLLPSDSAIGRIRQLSHRRVAAEMCKFINQLLPNIHVVHPAVEARSVDKVAELIESWGYVYVKLPWSGCGRGVVKSSGNPRAALNAARSFISSQGSAMVEPACDASLDFARIYRCRCGQVEDLGTSVFTTDSLGHYSGNLLAPESERFACVCKLYPEADLMRVIEMQQIFIAQTIAPYYDGILGVDMLIGSDGTIHPAVEINLRHTMGYAANRFAELHLHPDARGRFSVVSFRSLDQLPEEQFFTEGGRLVSGTLYLCRPPVAGFALMVEASI